MEAIAFAFNGSCFTLNHCNHMSTWTGASLLQRLHQTRSYSLKQHEVVFLKGQNLIFSSVAVSIWFVFLF